MFLRRYKLAISRIIIAVMVFASLAPTVSHALVSFTGNTSFSQKVCTISGNTIVIQVKTTLGKQLATALPVKGTAQQSAENHFEHCPFCTTQSAAVLSPTYNPTLVVSNEGRFFLQSAYLAPVLSALHQSDHPSRAPPVL
jgi:hypothetical protein